VSALQVKLIMSILLLLIMALPTPAPTPHTMVNTLAGCIRSARS